MKNYYCLFFFILITFLVSCSEDKANALLEVSETSIIVGAEASTETFLVKSDQDWSIVTTDKWYTISPASGKSGSTEVVISFSENTSKNHLKGSIFIQSGDLSKRVVVEQTNEAIHSLPLKNFTFDQVGGVLSIKEGANYRAILPEAADWLSVDSKDGSLKLIAKVNESDICRVAKVLFEDTNKKENYETLLIQKGKNGLTNLLYLTSLKINGIPCVLDLGNKEFYFPVDMEKSTSELICKLEFEGIGVESITVAGQDKKISSGDMVTFSEFVAQTRIAIKSENSLLDEGEDTNLNVTGLPIVTINAPEGIVDDPKRPCNMVVIDPKGRTNGNQVYYETYAGIEWRGSGALRYVKKAYGFKLWKDGTTESKDASILGLREDNNWILDAMWLDKARMRNRVCFDLWNEFNELYYKTNEPKALSGTYGHLVEVFLDGQYHGLYVLSDKLDRKQLKLKKSGGYLYKLGDWTDECMLRGSSSPYNNNSLVWNGVEMDYPDEIGSVEFKYYNNLLNFVSKSSKEDFSAQFEERIDVNNMVDCFIFTNLIMAYDNLGRNTYWGVYDVNKSEKMLPLVWDLDGTLGRTWDRQEENPNEGWLINSRHHGNDYRIYKRIYDENPANIHAKIKARWEAIKNKALSPDNLNKKLDYYGQQQVQSGAEKREIERWKGSPEYNYSDVLKEVKYIKDWYAKRWSKIDQLIREL